MDEAKAYEEGVISSKLKSNRQAYIRAIIHGVLIGTILYGIRVRWYFKVPAILMVFLAYGAIASTRRFRGKI